MIEKGRGMPYLVNMTEFAESNMIILSGSLKRKHEDEWHWVKKLQRHIPTTYVT